MLRAKKIFSLLLVALMLIPSFPIVANTAYVKQLGYASKFGTAPSSVTSAQQAVIDDYFPGVVCWGDSLTSGTVGTSYPYRLGEYIQSNIIPGFNTNGYTRRVNFGIGGENCATIVARSNAVPVVLKNAITIPASGKVAISIKLKGYTDVILPLGQQGGGNNYAGVSGSTGPTVVTIAGIRGKITRNGSNYYFTRSEAGTAVSVAAGKQVIFNSGNLYANTNMIPIVFMGTNDGADNFYNQIDKYIEYIDAILNKYPAYKNRGRYIVICPQFERSKASTVKLIEAKLQAKYGENLIKLREFMSTYGVYEMGITPTSTDLNQMAAGQVPSSLMSADDVHYNDTGYELLAKIVYHKLQQLGYFKEVIKSLGITVKSNGNTGSISVTTTHTHSLTAKAAKAATCTAAGNSAYWYCSGCSKYFSNSSGTTETTLAAVTIAALGHSYSGTTCTRCGATNGTGGTTSTAAVSSVAVSFNRNYTTDSLALTKKVTASTFSSGKAIGFSLAASKGSAAKIREGTAAEITSLLGAYAVHNVLLDSIASPSTAYAYSYVTPNCSDFWNDGKDSYIVYRMTGGSSNIGTLNISLKGYVRQNTNNYMKAYVLTSAQYNNGSFNLSSYNPVLNFTQTGNVNGAEVISSVSYNASSLAQKELYVVIAMKRNNFGSSVLGSIGATDTPYVGISGYKSAFAGTYLSGVKITTSASSGTTTHTHSLTAKAAKAATCTAAGNSAYWYCSGCGKYFSNSSGTTETTLAAVTIAALGHSYSNNKCTRCGLTSVTTAANAIYVSPTGSDSNSGTIDKPFKTIEAAKNAARSKNKTGGLTIYLRGGIYNITSSVNFTSADSGASAANPIKYMSYPGEIAQIYGGTKIPSSLITTASSTVSSRVLDSTAKSKLMQINLKSYFPNGIPKYYSYGNTAESNTFEFTVYAGSTALSRSRWPNSGYVKTSGAPSYSSTAAGSVYTYTMSSEAKTRMAKWNSKAKEDLFALGFWGYEYNCETATVTSLNASTGKISVKGGINAGDWATAATQSDRRLYFFNLPEEIDQPGECYIDFDQSIVYFYPTTDFNANNMYFSTLNTPMFNFRDTTNITLENIKFKYCLRNAIDIRSSTTQSWYTSDTTYRGFVIKNCTIAHTSWTGITAYGTNITIDSCKLFDTACGGISVIGGNKNGLISGNCKIVNTSIDKFNRAERTYNPAIGAGSLGMLIQNCRIKNGIHQGIAIGTNDVVIEYCEFTNLVKECCDMGAIYYGRDPGILGTTIRYNYFHNIGNGYGFEGQQSIYMDDGSMGANIHGNVFVDAGGTAGWGPAAIKSHGAQFASIQNNIFVDSNTKNYYAFSDASWGLSTGYQTPWVQYLYDQGSHTYSPSIKQKLTSVNFDSTVWRNKYNGTIWANLYKYIDATKAANNSYSTANANLPYKTNTVKNNVLVNMSGAAVAIWGNPNYTTTNNPTFATSIFTKNGSDYSLSSSGLKTVQAKISGFKNVPFAKMGVSKNGYSSFGAI